MNELPPSPDNGGATSPRVSSPSSAIAAASSIPFDGGIKKRLRPIYVLLLLLIVAAAAQWWFSHREISNLRGEVARRLQSGDSSVADFGSIAKQAQESSKELLAKVSVLESKQVESQSQQLALEQLYQDMSKNRDEWALSEIEEVLSTAGQQLQLAGNVSGAIIALQNADRTLARSDKPQFITIRGAIARDLDRLRALPTLDIAGIAVRLDSIIGQIDNMPLLSDEKPVVIPDQPKTPLRALPGSAGRNRSAVAKSDAPVASELRSDWQVSLQDKWQSLSAELWADVGQLIRVRRVDAPDALLMSPTQAFYVRENLKLRLLNARLALLSRNDFAFRGDLSAAADNIGKYFDTRARQTQTTLALLKQVQSSNLSIQMPTLSDSLNAVRNYKARR
ncbi:uroporphyrinogen-III C-methyltransferase [Herbaspirillum sp. RTI4]|uniref:uroporphyrinogen-III C-methyltransferase n=1 Tax=Herbaspirillum sp. RTI4 TaxID=3048640 RepID=UPI002AB3DBB5|nr:uroporphyrinogen-III C-methyltransferase [Herbaspirillum sp. RTI4]MDY7579466.1 uroporphyrinogen-III C-methyltransferase [Herbaspirillum sp. RTI4]MEA9980380.1 uroporphyrinogen-III C-methyltransferase [Herbaspirillum sp. RTI4]